MRNFAAAVSKALMRVAGPSVLWMTLASCSGPQRVQAESLPADPVTCLAFELKALPSGPDDVAYHLARDAFDAAAERYSEQRFSEAAAGFLRAAELFVAAGRPAAAGFQRERDVACYNASAARLMSGLPTCPVEAPSADDVCLDGTPRPGARIPQAGP